MLYSIHAPNGYGSCTDSKNCLPSKETLEAMYKAGMALYKNDKRLSKADALKELPPKRKEDTDAGTDKGGNKGKRA